MNATVGLDEAPVVLLSDHGAPEHADCLARLGIEAGPFDFERVGTEPGVVRVPGEFGAGADLIRTFSNPCIPFDRALIEERGLEVSMVWDVAARPLRACIHLPHRKLST